VTAALIVEPSLSPMNILQRRPVVSNISSRLAILNACLPVEKQGVGNKIFIRV
jgi:hypothetical protein